jgi:hypothetical protein
MLIFRYLTDPQKSSLPKICLNNFTILSLYCKNVSFFLILKNKTKLSSNVHALYLLTSQIVGRETGDPTIFFKDIFISILCHIPKNILSLNNLSAMSLCNKDMKQYITSCKLYLITI